MHAEGSIQSYLGIISNSIASLTFSLIIELKIYGFHIIIIYFLFLTLINIDIIFIYEKY